MDGMPEMQRAKGMVWQVVGEFSFFVSERYATESNRIMILSLLPMPPMCASSSYKDRASQSRRQEGAGFLLSSWAKKPKVERKEGGGSCAPVVLPCCLALLLLIR